MPQCLVGCCSEYICDCARDCECLLPELFIFDNPTLFANDALKMNEEISSSKICPCRSKDDISNVKRQSERQCFDEDNEDVSPAKQSSNIKLECLDEGTDNCSPVNSRPDNVNGFLANVEKSRSKEGDYHESGVEKDGAKTPDSSGFTVEAIPNKECYPETPGIIEKDGNNKTCGQKEAGCDVKKGCCQSNGGIETCGKPKGSNMPGKLIHDNTKNVTCDKKGEVGCDIKDSGRQSKAGIKPCGKATGTTAPSERRPSCSQRLHFESGGGKKDHDEPGNHLDPSQDPHYHHYKDYHHHHGNRDPHGPHRHHDDHRHHGSAHNSNGHNHCDDHNHDDDNHRDNDHPHGNDQHHNNDHVDNAISSNRLSNCSSHGCCKSSCGDQNCCEDFDCKVQDLSANSHEEMKPLVRRQFSMDGGKSRLQTTKLRVQNMCCPKESRIVEEELAKLEGISTVRVNVVGRVVHVSHHPDVVSPTELMIILNKRHLGVSIVDTGSEEKAESGLPKSLKVLAGFLVVQSALVSVAVGGKISGTSWYMWVAIFEICLGVIPVLKQAAYAVRNREIDLNILITVTVIGTLAIQEWIEGAAVVFVFTLASFLQQFCFYRVHKTITSLMLSKPSKAVMACTGECVPIEKVSIGSIIAVRQGELIPLDGVVVKGSASVDESSISGEATPVEKTLNSQTFSGTVIQHGYLEVKTTSSSTSSTISKISAMMEDAQLNVSPTEIMVNRFAKYYTPIVVVVALLVFLLPLILGLSGVDQYEGQIKLWGERALTVLVTACPCALLMAAPTVVICGINGAARRGALVKGGTFLEALAKLSFLAFDKTGTLTEGKFQVVDLISVKKGEESHVLRWAAALESKSSHPLAAAVVSEFTGECISDFVADSEEHLLPEVSGFRTMEGQGISGTVEGHYIEIGNHSLLEKLGITLLPKFKAAYIAFCSDSKTVVFVCIDGELALIISLADIIRSESSTALKWLQEMGIHLTMLTGDSKQTATAVQKRVQIDSCISEMKPDEKLEWISQIKEEHLRRRSCFRGKRIPIVGMVGDGVNDGPALAAADVGIAMAAGGSALAVEAAGVALMTNNVLKVPEIICLSRFCRRIIFVNIILAIVLKLVFVVVALVGFAHVWMAVVADLVGLLVVICNGLRPLWWKPPKSRKGKRSVPRASWRKKQPVFQYISVV